MMRLTRHHTPEAKRGRMRNLRQHDQALFLPDPVCLFIYFYSYLFRMLFKLFFFAARNIPIFCLLPLISLSSESMFPLKPWVCNLIVCGTVARLGSCNCLATCTVFVHNSSAQTAPPQSLPSRKKKKPSNLAQCAWFLLAPVLSAHYGAFHLLVKHIKYHPIIKHSLNISHLQLCARSFMLYKPEALKLCPQSCLSGCMDVTLQFQTNSIL